MSLITLCRVWAPIAFLFSMQHAHADDRFMLPPGGGFWEAPSNGCSVGGSVQQLRAEKIIYSYQYQNPWDHFIRAVGENLARASSDPSFDNPAFAAEVARVAAGGAFTQLNFDGPGTGSPVFATSATLVTFAYAVSLFDQTNAWGPEQRGIVVAWGNQLNKNQDEKYEYSSVDSLAAIGAARMAWGAVTRQPELFERGSREFFKLGKLLNSSAQFKDNLRDNYETVGLLVLAAEVAEQIGIQAYGIAFNGMTLHDAIERHAQATLEAGQAKASDDSGDQARSYLRASGYLAHVAWISICLSRFPDAPASVALREIAERAPKKTKLGMYGISHGGPTECLWGLVNQLHRSRPNERPLLTKSAPET